ncbi:MAG: ABC-2 family transporter protein [Hormoscilla sp. SP5CHS1]|nr:ABC-2 family transporter protein [Hormoscilla sp. SP5CHS1]
MNQMLRKARVLLVTYYAHMLEYRAELFFWTLSGSMSLIMMGIWMEAAGSGRFGLAPVDFARYFIAAFTVRQLMLVWVIWEFEEQVVQGKLSPQLLQPIDPVWRHVAMHLSEQVARSPFLLVVLGLFFALYPQGFWLPTLENLLLFILVIILAFIVRFSIQYTAALLAFWTERASAIEQLWFLLYLFLSGYIAPLEVFPPVVREIALWTPFPYFLHFPAAILVGLPVNVPRGLMTMLGWGMIFYALNRWLWRRGLKHYSGMGA